MSFQMKQLPLSIMQVIAGGAFAAFAIAPAMAQQASTDSTTQIQRVEVTGSNIKRSDKETAENVQVITAVQIKESGQTNVADFLRTLPASFASFNETSTNSFSPGAGGVALRGLSQKNTLVLLNGERITNYGFAQNLEDTYVDLNIIPINAIDHIDVLLDGASSVYGSDAIAGVVNIVLKSNYQGKEADVQYGAAQGDSKATYQSSITAGFGKLQDDGYNIMVAASLFHRDDLLASQRPMTAPENTSEYPGGAFGWQQANAYLTGTQATAFSTCGKNGLPGQVVNANMYPGGLTGTLCSYDSSYQSSIIPGSDRANVVVNGSLKLGDSITAFGDLFVSATKTKVMNGAPQTLGPTSLAYNPATGGATNVSNVLPVGNPSNPYSNPQGIIYAFNSLGTSYYDVNSYTTRLTGGLKGSINADWDWKVVAGVSENNVGNTNYNQVNVPALQTAIANGTYNFLNPSLTPAANAAIRANYEQASVAKLETLGATVNGSLFSLPAGEVQAAFGYEFRHESEDNVPDQKLLAGDILNYGATSVDGARSVNALYGELEVPILKTLTSNFALREEKYSDLGSNLSPKISLRFQPIDILTLRGAYSLGFRAPSLPEISNSSAFSFAQGIYDPQDPQKRPSISIGNVTTSNPNLQAEKWDNASLGFVLSPTRDLNLSMDYYRISGRDLVAPEVPQNIINNPSEYPGQVNRNAAGYITYTDSYYSNGYALYTRGEDVAASYVFHLSPSSKLTSGVNFTFVDHLDVNTGPGTPLQNFAGTDGWYWFSPLSGGGAVPRLRGAFNETWENHDWVVRGTTNFTSGYKEENCLDEGSCTGGLTGTAGSNMDTLASYVHSYTSFDLFTEYKGIKNWDLSMAITNLFNRTPPYDAGVGGIQPTLYDLTGRFINFRAAYKF